MICISGQAGADGTFTSESDGAVGSSVVRAAQAAGNDEQPVEELDDSVENMITNNTEIEESKRQALVSSRRGQGRFRQNLESIERKCRVTGVTDPTSLESEPHQAVASMCKQSRRT
jgi:hypothetical protein